MGLLAESVMGLLPALKPTNSVNTIRERRPMIVQLRGRQMQRQRETATRAYPEECGERREMGGTEKHQVNCSISGTSHTSM